MADFIIYLGIFFLAVHIIMLIVCGIKPKKVLWIIHLSSEAVTLGALFLFMSVFLQMLIDSNTITSADGFGLAILSILGLIAYGIVFALSLIIGIIRLLIWHEKKRLETKIIS